MKPPIRRNDSPRNQYLRNSSHKRRPPLWYVLGLVVVITLIGLYTGLVIVVAVTESPKAAIEYIGPLMVLIIMALLSRLRRPGDNDRE